MATTENTASHSGPSDARAAVVLAAGRGTRMKSELPKVAMPINGKAMVLHVLDTLAQLNLQRIVFVVGYRRDIVEELIHNAVKTMPGSVPEIRFALQEEQNGTAHALLSAEEECKDLTGHLLVTSGDMPLIQRDTFENLFQTQASKPVALSCLSARPQDPTGYGRMVRDSEGFLQKIVEQKDAGEETLKIQEVNAGTYIFKTPEIFSVLKEIDSNNKQNEYYLPDAIEKYRAKNEKIATIICEDYREALGANTVDELKMLENLQPKVARAVA